MYDKGQGVSQDYAEAVWWYRRAAEQGHPRAQTILGVKYEQGRGVPQNYTEAVQWYRRAAEQGNEVAQFLLGIKYQDGAGIPQDYVQAHFWFNLASAHLPPGTMRDNAILHRNLVAAELTPAQLARAQELASAWQPRPESPEASVEPSSKTATPPQLVQTAAPRRALIRQVQERLQAAGVNPGAIDGVLGPQTRNALRLFQNTKGVQATSELDEVTLDALGVR
jgi:hypothetical protein